ncbi:hypothetical protein DM38_361 [Brucella suis]|nr:hypothetical protein DM38_361 [Brucella suis]
MRRFWRCSARAHHGFKLALDAQDFFLKQASVSFDLGFTRAAKEAPTAALAFKVGPASDKASLLVVEMRQLHLKRAFLGARAFTENLQNEPGSVDDLGVPFLFKIALLHRRQGMIDNHQSNRLFLDDFGNGLGLARTKQRRGPRIGDDGDFRMFDIKINCARKPDRFLKARLVGTLELRSCAILARRAAIITVRQDGNNDGCSRWLRLGKGKALAAIEGCRFFILGFGQVIFSGDAGTHGSALQISHRVSCFK